MARSSLPCPTIVAERASVLADVAALDRNSADARALVEAGFASWAELAEAHRNEIECALDGLPAPNCLQGERLLTATRRFLASPFWPKALEAEWTIEDVFGIAPSWPSIGSHGLVPTVALTPTVRHRLMRMTAEAAVFSDSRKFRRPTLISDEQLGVWWQCCVLISEEAA